MLASVAALEAYLNLDAGNADEALLTRLLVQVGAFIEGKVARAFAAADYTETYDGNGSSYMALRQGPIVSISSLSIDDVPMTASSRTAYGYAFKDSAVLLTGGLKFSRGLQNVDVSYRAGYETIPADVELAVIEGAALVYKRRGHLDMSSQAMAGSTTSYLLEAMPESVAAVINTYRRVVPA